MLEETPSKLAYFELGFAPAILELFKKPALTPMIRR
jgi:hypothetical protein